MVAAGRGFLGVVEQLLNMGANVAIRSSNDWRAVDWARKYDQQDIAELIEAYVLVGISKIFQEFLIIVNIKSHFCFV